ncbi:GldG family protein [Candidatus Fermentibacteria bacterium]|nr:GldG family protein [Candidatus Fermentibacteria bacterium]
MKRIQHIAAIGGVALLAAGLVLATAATGSESIPRITVTAGLVLLALWPVLAIWRAGVKTLATAAPMVLGSLLVLAIVVIVNVGASRHTLRWDITATKRFTLSEQTRQVLHALPGSVEAIAFTQSDDRHTIDLLKEYAAASRGFSFRVVDPDRQPEQAQAHQIRDYGTVVISMAGRTERVSAPSEETLTSALMRLKDDRRITVHVLTGHGGRSTVDEEKTGLSSLVEALLHENYDVEERIILRDGVPSTDDLLLVPGPMVPLLAAELDSLNLFLAAGGRALLLLEPEGPSLEEVTLPRGITARKDVIVDASGVGRVFGMSEVVPLVAHYSDDHPITRSFTAASFFPLARSLDVTGSQEDSASVTCIAETGTASWAETGSLTSGTVAWDPHEREGPLCVGAAASWPCDRPEGEVSSEGRLVVFGDVDFLTNAFLTVSGNRDLGMNALSWLAERGELIAIRPRSGTGAYLTLSADAARSIFLLVVVVLPGAVLVAGIAQRWRRR